MINKVILLGRLGNDPELKYTPGGEPVCKFSLATSEVWVARDGNKHEETEWHKVVAWGKMGENCAKYLSKGRQVYIEGKIKQRSWDDKESNRKCYATEIIAATVQFIGDNPQQSQQRSSASKPSPQPTSVGNLEDIPF